MLKRKKEGLLDRMPLIPIRKTPILDRLRSKSDLPKVSDKPSLQERSKALQERVRKREFGTTKRPFESSDEECSWCDAICNTFGNEEWCREQIKLMEDNTITEAELGNRLIERYGADWEDQVWDRLKSQGFTVID